MKGHERSVIEQAIKGEIKLLDAELILRRVYGSGLKQSKYQKIYNYLDELAGMIEGEEETVENRQDFLDFLGKIGFPSDFD